MEFIIAPNWKRFNTFLETFHFKAKSNKKDSLFVQESALLSCRLIDLSYIHLAIQLRLSFIDMNMLLKSGKHNLR